MVGRKPKTFAKDANYAVDFNRLRDRMNGCGGVDCLLDIELSKLRMKQNCGVGNTKNDMGMDDDDLFDENYLTYLLDLEKSSVKLDPVEEDEADPEYVMFLENLKEHGNSYKLDVPVEHGVPIEEHVADPQYLMFLDNLKEHGNSYMVVVPLVHGVPLRIMYEEENVHSDDAMKWKGLKNGCQYNIREDRNNAKKTRRRLAGVHTTQIKRNRGGSTKRNFLCPSSNEYIQDQRNIAEKNDRRNASSYGVRNTLKKRTRGESRRKNTEERTQADITKGKNSCSSSDSYAQAEMYIVGKNNRRNLRSYGVSNTLKKKTRGESMERKISHSRSPHVYVQEKRNISLKNNKRNVGSYGVNSAQKERTCGKGTKRNNSYSSTNGCDVLDVMISDSSETNTSNLKDSDFCNRMAKSLDEDVQEKRTVAEVTKKRKLMSHTGNHIREGRNLKVSHGKKSGAERSGSSKLITKPHSSDHFQGKQTTEKNNPISASFADFQDKKRTEEKNPFPLNPDDFKEDQCVNVQEKRTVAEVSKKRKLMSHTGNHIREGRNLKVSHGKKSGAERSGSSKLITKPHSSDHFQGKQTAEKNNPISVSFADFQDKKRTEEKNPFPLNPDDFKEDQCVNVQEKRTVGEVIKKRKLMSDTGNHIREERNLNVSHGKKSGVEGSGSSKIITKPHSSDHFQGKQTMEKKNRISVRFADFQDKERTEEKNPIPLNPDDFKEDQWVNVQEKRTVGEVIKKRKLMSDTGNHIREERNLNVSHGKKSGVAGSGSSKIIKKPQNSSFKEDQCVNVIINSRSAPKNSSFQKSVVNEVYDLFLKNLKVIGESVVYKFGDNERVLYELSCKRHVTVVADSGNPPIKSDQPIKNNLRTSIAAESSDQSTRKIVAGLPLTVRVATEKQPTRPSTSFIPASRSTMPLFDKQPYNSLKVSHRVPSNMRKKLLVILNQPYSEQEHEQLWKEVSFRSAVLTHRDSRSGGSHRPGQMGRSLLDWNPDLSSEIDKVKSDPPKVLNLLRMLSFYIKKLPCGNICKPWMDDSLMTMIHGSA
ncbi:uncharacterized protein LOC141605489 isoform X1 [Silene latifolia]|uniref:uncharacterized protein LOC141605489 isoform X1 n=1 Tax=Silene latifolia TaxID=37657 RepID=UPI003D773220